MKKALLYFTLISITLLSCKKDKRDQTKPQGKLYPVTFTVSNFTQEISPNQSNKIKINDVVSPDQANVQLLIYEVYDQQNNLINSIKQKKGELNFGTIKDNLPPGNYSAAFIGVIDADDFVLGQGTFSYPQTNLQDTYYKKLHFTIGDQYVEQNIVLEHLLSQVQAVIKDPIPAGITDIDIAIQKVDQNYNYITDISLSTNSFVAFIQTPVPSAKIGTTNFALQPLVDILKIGSPVTIVLSARNKDNSIVTQKTINNVSLQPNTKTTITGNLFTDSSSGNNSGFSVNFDQPANPDINQSF
jgi:hypothetical protein